jgi:hypothetical protein
MESPEPPSCDWLIGIQKAPNTELTATHADDHSTVDQKWGPHDAESLGGTGDLHVPLKAPRGEIQGQKMGIKGPDEDLAAEDPGSPVGA